LSDEFLIEFKCYKLAAGAYHGWPGGTACLFQLLPWSDSAFPFPVSQAGWAIGGLYFIPFLEFQQESNRAWKILEINSFLLFEKWLKCTVFLHFLIKVCKVII
jgi:hypothetical protein